MIAILPPFTRNFLPVLFYQRLFIVLYTAVDGDVEEYMYKRFFFYEDEKELCSQLEQASAMLSISFVIQRRISASSDA